MGITHTYIHIYINIYLDFVDSYKIYTSHICRLYTLYIYISYMQYAISIACIDLSSWTEVRGRSSDARRIPQRGPHRLLSAIESTLGQYEEEFTTTANVVTAVRLLGGARRTR